MIVPHKLTKLTGFFMLSATKLIQSRMYDEPESCLLTDPQFCKKKHLYIITNLIPFVHRHPHFNSLLLGKAPGIGSKPNKPPGVFTYKTSSSIENKQIGGLVLDCSISIASALEILQSCDKPSK